MYQVLARRWRPQTFAELVGQPQVVRTLSNAIGSDRLAHAYIFAGLRGTGKTSAARILAKCLNCAAGPTSSPCGTCDPCREIAESQAIDVIEIDAASRTKVEQTRELLELISYAPVRDRYKILIIDEVHMLSKASFNALLKTIEEPPPNVIFVLATTELQKVLPTILSRCQVFEFRRVSALETARHLRKVCGQEKINISDDSLERIARAGEGSVRDSLSLIERVIAFCGNDVDDEEVLRLLGTVRNEVLSELFAAMARRDAAAMLSVLDGLVDEGHDLVHFWSEWIRALRDLLLLRTVPDRPELLARSADEGRALSASAEGLSREDLSRVFQILAELETPLKTSAEPRFLFEATIIRLASLGAVRPIEDVLAALGGEASTPSRGPGGGAGGTRCAGEERDTSVPSSRTRRAAGPSSGPAAPERGAGAAPEAAGPTPGAGASGASGTEARRAAGGVAAAFRSAVAQAKPMLGAVLDEALEIRVAGQALVVLFAEGKDALRRQMERNLPALTDCARAVAGSGAKVLFSSASDAPAGRAVPDAVSDRVPGERDVPRKATRDAGGRGGGASRPASDRQRLIQRAKSEPGVQKLLIEFGAQVVDIRPLKTKETP